MLFSVIFLNISERLTGALCNALLQSLWQGILLAFVTGLVILCTRKTSAGLRYNLLVTALLLFTAGFAFTFFLQFQHTPVAASHPLYAPYTGPGSVYNNPAGLPVASPGYLAILADYINSNHAAVVLVWFFIICAKSIQLIIGLYGTHRLRRYQTGLPDEAWRNRVQVLADSLGIKKTVVLLESALVKVPLVIGELKPVILVPVSLFTKLTVSEAEAVLMHELAHIYRRDYLVNLLQSLVEIVFFFNPAVLWISQLIKTERENCCDDLAVQHTQGKDNYIRALVSCEEYQSAIPVSAMAFPGGKNSLFDRVKRMATKRNHSLGRIEKTILAVCLVAAGFFISAYSARTNKKQYTPGRIVAAIPVHTNAFQNKPTIKQAASGKQTVVNIKNTQQPLPVRQKQAVPKDTLIRSAGTVVADTSIKNGDEPKDRIEPAWRRFHAMARELFRMKLVSDTDHIAINLDDNQLVVNGFVEPSAVHGHFLQMFGNKKTGYENSKRPSTDTHAYERTAAGYAHNNSYTSQSYQPDTNYKAANRAMIADLFADGLITTADPLSFKLTSKEFILNGELQREGIFRKYKGKYVPANDNTDWTWTHNVNTNQP